ncbi:hypothetical protein HYW53_03655 [Candidatus Giovannonibacteria bacterium]|nr:hypothetical protein [Candidatus Giovannonibacteria bacterium]
MTLIENIFVILIVFALAAVIIASFMRLNENNALAEAHANILGLLSDARARTLASESNSSYGVHFEADRAVFFKGALYDSSDASNEIYLLPSVLTVSSISLGGASDVIFARLSGNSSAAGTLTIQSVSDSSKSRTISIYATGIAK